MNYRFFLSLALASIASFGSICAMKESAYKGIEITAKSLPKLMQGNFPIPQQLDTATEAWLQAKSNSGTTNKELLMLLMKNRYAGFTGLKLELDENTRKTAQAGYQANRSGTYTFNIPHLIIDNTQDNGHQIKIAGPIHRINNLLTYAGQPHLDVLVAKCNRHEMSGQELEAILQNLPRDVNTYQGPSRAAFFLKVKEAIEQHQLKHIDINPVYMKALSENAQEASDRDYIIIEANGLQGQALNATTIKKVAPEAILDLCIIAQETGNLWDALDNHIFINPDTNKLTIKNLEQANACGSQEFFNKKRDRYEVYTKIYFENLMSIIKDDKEKVEMAQAFVLSCPDLQQYHCYNEIKRIVGLP